MKGTMCQSWLHNTSSRYATMVLEGRFIDIYVCAACALKSLSKNRKIRYQDVRVL